MARRTSAAAAERDVIRHCHSGLDVAGVQQQVLRALRRLMPVDAAFFATADPETLLFTSAYAEEPLAASTPRFLDNEFGGGDVNTFASLATSATHVASLDGATRHDRFASGRYSDIMRPIGLGDELRAALVARSTCWGYLCLHRADDPRGFSEKEAALITRLGPHIAHALRQAMLLHPAVDPGSARPGVVLLADDLSVVATTPDAEHLMSLIDDGSPALPLPVAVYAAASALGALERGSPLAATLPSARVRTSAGHWLNVHASRLQGRSAEERRIAVVLEPAQPHATTPTLLDAHGLTPRETDVARLVLRGESTRAISDTLHITTNTVQDHLKAIFDKTGVRSRRALVGLLLGPPPPRVRAEPTSGTSVGT